LLPVSRRAQKTALLVWFRFGLARFAGPAARRLASSVRASIARRYQQYAITVIKIHEALSIASSLLCNMLFKSFSRHFSFSSPLFPPFPTDISMKEISKKSFARVIYIAILHMLCVATIQFLEHEYQKPLR
jgi:hypothetical protein